MTSSEVTLDLNQTACRVYSWVLISTLFLGCATKPDSQQNLSSPVMNEEVRIGHEIRDQVLSNFRVYTEPTASDYVRKTGMNLAKQVERKNLPYEFIILYSEKIYATSAPGGTIFITTGMIAFLQNESELAAVLAHELGEIQDKDPKLSRSRSVMHSVLQSSAALAPAFGQFGILAMLGLAVADSALTPKIPTLEGRMYKADERAFRYMVQSGYDPQGLIDLQYRFLTASAEFRPYFYDYYQSRPVTEERMQRISRAFDKLPLENKSFSTHREIFVDKLKGIRGMNQTAV